MKTKSRLLVAALGLAVVASASAASAETRWERQHPRQDQVLDRDAHLRREIRAERRAGEISPARAHRLLVKDRHIAREDHAIARTNGGYISPREQHIMNRQETRLARHVPS